MPDLERVTFEDLPEIGDAPLEGKDLLTIMRWSVERGGYIAGLKQEALEARDALDTLWGEEPEILVGDIDNPALSRFKPTRVYDVATEFGLKTAQLEAYSKLHGDAVKSLNNRLFDHFQGHNTKIAVTAPDSTGAINTGVFRLSGNENSWDERVRGAVGYLVDIDVNAAAMRLEATTGGLDIGVLLLPTHSPIERTDYVDIALQYPALKTAA